MERLVSLLMAASLAGTTIGANADNRTLELDGRFYVAGASMRTARVIITRTEGERQEFTDDIRHLALQLDLQEVYLLTFERKGCRSKSILFDTRMDEADVARGPFTFHFDVTLEVARDETVKYMGPVGYVKYSPSTMDFGYDLDYRLTHDAKGGDLADGPSQQEAVSVSTKRARAERHRVQPFIDPTRAMELEAERHAMEAGYHDEGKARNEQGCASTGPIEGITFTGAAIAPRYGEEDQQRSVVVEQEREITIVRVMDGAHLSDYRRIRHTDGTTWHFKNGSNCSYQEYIAAVGSD